jgi:NAD(P)-dependent dehydrogenase (short-subunit alcohol dehydrogenase family)
MFYQMVANAGIFVANPFIECTLEDWDKSFNINGKGVFLCYKYAALKMIEQGRGGRIIGACSRSGKRGKRRGPCVIFDSKNIKVTHLRRFTAPRNSLCDPLHRARVSYLFVDGSFTSSLGSTSIETTWNYSQCICSWCALKLYS